MNNNKIINRDDDSIIGDLNECRVVWDKSYDVDVVDIEKFPWEKDIPSKELDCFINYLLSKNTKKEGIKILDFGCGTGRLGRYIENNHKECKGKVYYYDISEAVLNVCYTKYCIPKERILFPKLNEIGKEKVFDQENLQFDGIIIWGIFHHLPERLRNETLRLVKKILAPNGVLLVAEFDSKDLFFRNRDNRVSEITGKKSYSINLRKLLGEDFNFLQFEYYNFEENQQILEERIVSSTNSDEQRSKKKDERLNQNRKISYAIVEYSLLGKLKKAVVEGFNNSDFAHFLGYNFLTSLNMPEHSVGEYYANTPKKAKQMWLHSMGLFKAYDEYRTNREIKEEPLLESQFTLLLFHKALKRYSFIVESIVDESSGFKIELKDSDSQNSSVFTNLYEIKLIVPKTLLISEYVKSFRDNDKKEYWDYEITNKYIKDTEISFHRCAIHHLKELYSTDNKFNLFDGNDLDAIFMQLDKELMVFIEKHPELKELRQAIMMILLFVYPIETDSVETCSSELCTKKTYIALVPPAFEMPLMKSPKDIVFKEISAGGAIIYTSGRPFDDDIQKNRFLWNVMKWSSVYTAKEIAEYTFRMTVKAAKAAIMSRNMSHNLGSHVMFYIKQKLQSVERIFKEEALAKLFKFDSEGKLDASVFLRIVDNSNIENQVITGLEMPFLVGLGRFINYLQERQDYIATVATDYIPYKSTINFKDAIFDELKPELRSQRHALNKTNPKGKEAANLLLDYIAYSEGFEPSDRIEIWFESFNGHGEPKDVPTNLRNLNVSLPGGNLGRQAFFSIMENIIRNTAKHDGNKFEGRNLKFRFDKLDSKYINENIKYFESFTNEHNYSDLEEVINAYDNHKDDYHYLGITVDLGGDVDLSVFEKIGKGLNKEYVTPDGQIDDSNKGIKEIRISAAWLRGFSLDTIIPNDEPPAVAIINKDGNLQYVICLPKPKKVAFLTGKNKELDHNGCREFAKPYSTKEIKEIADFELIVGKESDCDEIRKHVCSRLLVVPSVDDYLKKEIGDLYEEWLKDSFKNELKGGKLPTLVINDEQSFKHRKDDDNKSFTQLLIESGRVMINSSDDYSNQLVYSKHYDTSEAKQDIKKKFYEEAAFLEGISGGNSTDRLLRHDLWTMEWYVKHMTAALTQVAVFDERIYSNFVKHGSSPYADWNEEKLEEWLGEFENNIKLIENPQVFLWQKARETISTDVSLVDVKELLSQENGQWIITKDLYKLQQFIKKLHRVDVPADCSSAELYAQKGIWAFTIVSEVPEGVDSTSSKVIVYGYKDGKERRIATLCRNKKEDGDKILCSLEGGYDKKFHFITIHQGILDKIYETLSVENKDKELVTEELFDKFSRLKKSGSFLPQFVIHSGRSLPNKKDMPQEQPFIQFAALDHAIRDCKYTLTELLYSAHYE